MKKTMKFLLLSLAVLFIGLSAMAQSPYGEVNFIKVLPNMGESFLIDMKTSKKLQNGRVANKTITSWQLYRRTYPRGSSMEYNYATLSVFPSGKEMKAQGTWDAAIKGLSVQDISDFFTSLNNVRSVVATDLYTHKMGTGSRILPGDYVQLNLVNAKTGSNAAYEKVLESLKPVIDECIAAGKLKGYNVWKRTYNTNVWSESDYTVSFSFSTLDQALSWVSGKTSMTDEYKKVYPKEDINIFTTKLNELRELVSQELWELVDSTD